MLHEDKRMKYLISIYFSFALLVYSVVDGSYANSALAWTNVL